MRLRDDVRTNMSERFRVVRPIWTAPKTCPDCGEPMYYSTSAGGHIHDHSGGFMCDKDRPRFIKQNLMREGERS